MDAKRILLAEDNTNDVELTLTALAEQNFHNEVVVARDNAEALDYLYARGAFAGRPPGDPILVLLDLKMPRVDGLEVLRQIKGDAALQAMPVVMLTSSREEQDLVESYRLGVNAYVVKPVVFDNFLDVVKNLGLLQKMESIGTLASGIAHDFNNLLTAIQGNIDLLSVHLPPNPMAERYLTHIHAAAVRAASLTQQPLIFSHQHAPERKPIQLNDTLAAFAAMLRRIIGERVDLRLEYASDMPPVCADPFQIDQVVMNLAVNARDAMPDGGQLRITTQAVTLEASACQARPGVAPGAYVQLSVSDTGCGMDAAVQQRIFEPFFTTKDPGKGTGLGLAVVYGIIKQHEGFIQVASTVGQGTSMHVYLPAVDAEPVVDVAPQVSAPQPQSGTETLLVAEDDPFLQELALAALTHLGYTVLMAADGHEAVALFTTRRDAIDLVMLDVVMPGMDGLAAYAAIRALGSEVPVLFLSGYSADMSDLAEVMAQGALLLQKPYTLPVLAHTVRQALARTPQAGPAA